MSARAPGARAAALASLSLWREANRRALRRENGRKEGGQRAGREGLRDGLHEVVEDRRAGGGGQVQQAAREGREGLVGEIADQVRFAVAALALQRGGHGALVQRLHVMGVVRAYGG